MRSFREPDKFEVNQQNSSQFFQYVSQISEKNYEMSQSKSKKTINQQKLNRFLASIYSSKKSKNTSYPRLLTSPDLQGKQESKQIQKTQQLQSPSQTRIELPSMPVIINKHIKKNIRANIKNNLKKVSIVLSPKCCVQESQQALESILLNKPKLNKIQQKYRFMFNGRTKSLQNSQQSLIDEKKLANWTDNISLSKPLHKLSMQMRVNRLAGIRYSRNQSSLLNPTKKEEKDRAMMKRSQTPALQLKPLCFGIGDEERTILSPPSKKFHMQHLKRKRRLEKLKVKV